MRTKKDKEELRTTINKLRSPGEIPGLFLIEELR